MTNVTDPSTLRQDDINILTRHFHDLIQFIRKNCAPKKIDLTILLGMANSGKTSLLLNSNLATKKIIPKKPPFSDIDLAFSAFSDTHLTDHSNLKQTDTTEDYCYWWITEKNVYLDIPGFYLSHEDGVPLREVLFNLLKRYKKYFNHVEVLLVFDLPTFVDYDHFFETHPPLKNTLTLLNQHFGCVLPVTIVISKTDHLRGFVEYFAHLNHEDLQSLFGLSLPQIAEAYIKNKQISLSHLCHTEFKNFCNQLSASLLNRLHHEHNSEKRALIFEFPWQFEQLKDAMNRMVGYFLEKLSFSNTIVVQGIFLSSAFQSQASTDLLSSAFFQVTGTQSQALTIFSPKVSKPHFIQALFKTTDKNQAQIGKIFRFGKFYKFLQQYAWTRYFTLIIPISVSAIVAIGLLQIFNSDLAKINRTERLLAQSNQSLAKTNFNLSSPDTLNLIEQFSQASSSLNSLSPVFFFNHFWFTQTPVIALKNQYQQLLQGIFLPYLAKNLAATLNSPNIDPPELYNDLKAYLMLGEPSEMQPAFFVNWLQAYWQKQIRNIVLQTQMMNHLKAIDLQNFRPVELDKNLIQAARARLNLLPTPYLAYLIIKDEAQYSHPQMIQLLSLNANSSLPIFSENNAKSGIPYLYTAAGFKNVFLTKLQNQANTLASENWVLSGNNQPVTNSTTPIDVAVINMYFSDYANWWQNTLNQLQMMPIHNFEQLLQVVDVMTQSHNSLQSMLKTINENTNSDTLISESQNLPPQLSSLIQAAIEINISSRLPNFTPLLKNSADLIDEYNQIDLALLKLRDYLNIITQSNDQNAAAFNLAELRFANPSTNDPISNLMSLSMASPEPLRSWLQILANMSWSAILTKSNAYIELQWQNKVLPFYLSEIDGSYPFFTNGSNDVDIHDFVNFFSQNGILFSFFNQYLKPFINTQTPEWQLLTLDGQSLAISNNFISMLERGNIIQQMFFPNHDNNLEVKFTLLPISVGPNVKQIELKYGTEAYTTLHNKFENINLTWPGSSQGGEISLAVTDNNNHVAHLSTRGDWAWFKLLDEANIQTTSNAQDYQLTFIVANDIVRYKLTASNLINPFIPEIINEFRCPKRVDAN